MARKKQKTEKVVVLRFTVEGDGTFPFDMLRYDCCHPVHETEARYLLTEAPHRRRVTLEHRGNGIAPTERRWESFSWKVVRIGDEPTKWEHSP
jgi:hypothetical protein